MLRYFRFSFCVLSFSVLFLMQGCLFRSYDGSEIMNTINDRPTSSGRADVTFKLAVPDSEAVLSAIRPASEDGGVSVIFRLILIFPGNDTGKQVVILRKFAEVSDDGSAEISFSGVPETAVIGEMRICGGGIGGKARFHGALDLKAGANVVEIAPLGSGHPSELAAGVLLTLVDYPEIIRHAPDNLVASLMNSVQTTVNSGLSGSGLLHDALDRFVKSIQLSVPAMTRVTIANDGGLMTESGSSAEWSKTPAQLWASVAGASDLNAFRVIRHGLGNTTPPIVAFTDVSRSKFALAVLNPESGEITSYFLSDGTGLYSLSSVFPVPFDNSMVFGAVANGLPVLIRWNGKVSVTSGWPTTSDAVVWSVVFPHISAAGGLPRPEIESILFDSDAGDVFNCMVRDPGTLRLYHFTVSMSGDVNAAQTIPETDAPWNLTAIPASGAITLHWDAVPNADNYTIFWSLNSDIQTSGDNVNAFANVSRPFTHSGLQNGVEYHYIMEWTAGGIKYGPSRQVSAIPEAQPENAARYSITYLGNDQTSGSVPMDALSYEPGSSVTVMQNTGSLKKTGYVFAGWNTVPDGSGLDFAPDGHIQIDSAHIMLYAKWKQNCAVIYDGNGSDGGSVPDVVRYPEGAAVTVAGNTGNLTLNGRTFDGWNTAADGTGTSYAAGAEFTMGNSDVTLYARWNMFNGGAGTQDTPYVISNAGQLNNVRFCLDACFVQIADIDLGIEPWSSGTGWEPIGSYTSNLNFTGVYDGNGHKINNLYINRDTDERVGLFGYTSGATIKNLTVENADVTAKNSAGALIGMAITSDISGCASSGKIQVLDTRAGGLVGAGSGITMNSCSSSADVSGNVYLGGLLGELTGSVEKSTATGCFAAGKIMGSYCIGGLIGSVSGKSTLQTVISNCHATGEVSGNNHSIGGLIGSSDGYSTIDSSYAAGRVFALKRDDGYPVTNVGGLAGISYSVINKSYAIGSVEGGFQVGGLIGEAYGSVSECYAVCNVSTDNSRVGGLIGLNYSNVTNSHAGGSVTGHDRVGGLCGLFHQGTVDACYSTGLVTGGKDQPDIGGLCGFADGTIDNSFWNTTTSGKLTSSGGGTGLDSVLMKKQSSFPGWDFDSVWTIVENNDYPRLRYQ